MQNTTEGVLRRKGIANLLKLDGKENNMSKFNSGSYEKWRIRLKNMEGK